MTPLPLHGVGSRRDLPLPFELVLAGAGATLLVTAFLLALAWRAPRYTHPAGRPLPSLSRLLDSRPARACLALAGMVVWGWFGLALVAGVDRVTNPVFGWVFACLWVGVVPASLLLGPVVRLTHPARALGLLLGRRASPRLARWGVWPAALATAGFAWLELVQPGRATLPVLRWFALAYWGWLVLGVVWLGRGWVRAADPFSACGDLVARLSPWQRVDGTVRLTNPLRHAATAPVPRGTWGLVAVLLGATAMDSWTGSWRWLSWAQGSGIPLVLAQAGALALTTSVVAVTLWLTVRLMRRDEHPTAPRTSLLDDLAATCAPIAAGYALAHYGTMLAVEGPRTLINASDPLGRGWNVLGTAELGVSTWFLELPWLVALGQVVAIVCGHVLGVLLAHERCLVRLRPGRAIRGQVPLLVLMVGYTLAGLLLLFSG